MITLLSLNMVNHSLNYLYKTCFSGINIIISKFIFNDSNCKSNIKIIKAQTPKKLRQFSSIYYKSIDLLALFYRIMIE